MSCRPTVLTGAALAALLALAAPITRADSINITTYSLTNNNPAGSAPLTQILAAISPIGAFDTTSTITPLQAGSDVTQYGLTSSFGNGTIPAGNPSAGQPLQVLQLDLANGGLAPGSSLDFALRMSQSYQGSAPTLSPITSGVAFGTGVVSATNDNPATTGTSITAVDQVGSTVATPEPAALLIWSALASLGLFRARHWRQRRSHRGLAWSAGPM